MRLLATILCVVLCALQSGAAWAEETEKPTVPRHNIPFIYFLQNLDLHRLIKINPAVAVIDPYDSRLEPKDIGYIKRKYGIRMIAYLSVGEVDPSRRNRSDGYIFREEWEKEDWLVKVPRDAQENETWGTLRVEYWDTGWRAIVAYRVKKLVDMGYDGIMLDTVDSFYVMSEVYERNVKQDMANLVGYIRDVAHAKNPDFLIYINGGMELYDTVYDKTDEPFLDIIDGQLKEDTWYNEKGTAQADWTNTDLAYLKRALQAGIPVFSIDYFTNDTYLAPNRRRLTDYMLRARQFGVIPFAADRSLGKYLLYNEDYYKSDHHWDTAIEAGVMP